MPDLWLDTDSLVTPSRGPYRFGTLPKFWDYLEQKAEEQCDCEFRIRTQGTDW